MLSTALLGAKDIQKFGLWAEGKYAGLKLGGAFDGLTKFERTVEGGISKATSAIGDAWGGIKSKFTSSQNVGRGAGDEITILTAASENPSPLQLSREDLSPHLRSIHDRLPQSGAVETFRKKDVSMRQLNQLGRVTGDEYSVFTRGSERIVIRGYGNKVNVSEGLYADILEGRLGRWSGHTHPPGYGIEPGPGDRPFLQNLQLKRSTIWGIDDSGKSHFRFYGELPVNDGQLQSELMRQKWMKYYGQSE